MSEFRWTLKDSPNQKLIIRSEDSDLVTISLDDGTVEFGEDYNPEEAARTFWDAIQLSFSTRLLATEEQLREAEARIERMATAGHLDAEEEYERTEAAEFRCTQLAEALKEIEKCLRAFPPHDPHFDLIQRLAARSRQALESMPPSEE